MRRAVSLLGLVSLLGACREASTPTPDISATKEDAGAKPAPPAPSPKPLPAPAPSAFPALTDACVADSDCGDTHYGKDCCFRCETSVGDKAWAKRVDAYCLAEAEAGRAKGCNPTLCAPPGKGPSLGYVNAIPRCVDGHCKK